ncbi:hypothetical protein [Azospirillum rugosum]|uniref:Uncharacterized protein n=1 Tax=Azospirillum rugosum TaxID=416170 RepID=A0ABS4SIV0_9PROT|nr:hypothetical protein [Azospirillum rugosum]MBP2291998.1 hypothetical protein [Azospirillum rugosum]MDQ0525866.1 hypothetical protein [Azospirillum rugosum]
MAHIVEIRNGAIVGNDEPSDEYLPIGTHITQADGFYVSFGMDVEGPYDRADAEERLDHLKKATQANLQQP